MHQEVTITIVPPAPAPLRVTAHACIKDLRTHMLAFLNANNKHGFLTEQSSAALAETIDTLFYNIVNKEFLRITYLKDVARQVTALTVKGIVFGRALHLIARLMGYMSWSVVKCLAGADGYIRNLRLDMVQNLQSVASNDAVGYMHAPKVTAEEQARIKTRERQAAYFKLQDKRKLLCLTKSETT